MYIYIYIYIILQRERERERDKERERERERERAREHRKERGQIPMHSLHPHQEVQCRSSSYTLMRLPLSWASRLLNQVCGLVSCFHPNIPASNGHGVQGYSLAAKPSHKAEGVYDMRPKDLRLEP